MKRFLFSVLTGILAVACMGQQSDGFKQIQKKPSGSTRTGLVFKTVPSPGFLKSSDQPGRFQIAPQFTEPARLADSSVKRVVKSNQTRLPVLIEMVRETPKSTEVASAREEFYAFFERTRSITSIRDPREELAITSIHTDKLGITHVKAKQYCKGIEVYGGELILHLYEMKMIFTGTLRPVEDQIGVVPEIDAGQALRFVMADLEKGGRWKALTPKQKEMLKYEDPVPKLVIFSDGPGSSILCYEIDLLSNIIERWKYFINAENGAVVHKFNTTHSDGPAVATAVDLNGIERTIDTYLENGYYYLVNAAETMYNETTGEGIIYTLDANNTSSENLDYSHISTPDNTWDHPSGISAHYNATTTYRYLENTFGRNSLNDQGGDIISLVNVTNEDGSSMENAYWTGYAAFYGNGGDLFKPLAGALDVTAHEMGHGVVSNTANLEYIDQSGAINETYADIFGSMVDREDWLIGEDIMKPGITPSGALRDMSNPHNLGESIYDWYWQPMHVSEMYIGEEDNGGVHTNSGIGNYAYYLYATAVTKEKAELVFYRALTTYLTKKSQFIDFRLAVVQSAVDLFGENSTEVLEANQAFDAVGIFEEEPVDYQQDYPVNNGAEYLLSYDTDTLNPNTIYRSSVSGDDFYALSTTLLKGKPSVLDNGAAAVFVSDDSKIRAINLDPENPDERIISQEAFWDNVAVSRDGNRVAAVSTEIDTAIYVYDFISQQWTKFRLYNPTTSHSGADAGGVLFADAIEFDHSGEYLIYDAYNLLATTVGGSEEIDYWDIGIIRVWDNSNNTFGDGTVEKLFGSLPEGVSIGNPVFAKNSPYIIAFDYWDSYEDDYGILGANLITGEVDAIVGNVRLGYPSFSNSDSKLAYTTLNVNDNDLIAEIGLAQDKISASGDPAGLVGWAIWPVYYANGTRSLGLAPVANFTCDQKTGNVPLTVQFIDLSINEPTLWSWSFEGGDPDFSQLQNPVVVFHTGGTYQVTLTATNSTGSHSVTKTSYINVVDATGIDEVSNDQVRLYPNPVSGILHIDCNNAFNIRVFNMTGNLMLSERDLKQIDMGGYEPGVYVVIIETAGGTLYEKVIRN